MAELEHALRTVGQNLEYPATPDISGAVRRQLTERPPPDDSAKRATSSQCRPQRSPKCGDASSRSTAPMIACCFAPA